MSLLFDISPEDPHPEKKKQKRAKGAGPAAVKDGEDRGVLMPSKQAHFRIIGRSEGHYECLDVTCKAGIFDILDEYRDEWFIECMICGTGQRVPAIPGVIKAPDRSGDFVFADGKFEGFAIAQVAEMEHGQQYIAWASANHKREAVRTACKNWLDAISASA